MLKYRLLILLIIPFLFIGCSDDPTSIGTDLLGQDLIDVAVLDSQVDSLHQTSSSFLKTLQLTSSSKLFLGKLNNIEEASILIRFQYDFEDTVKTDFLNNALTIRQAYVELVKTYSVGSGTLDYTVHRITSDWNHTGFSGDSLTSLSFQEADLSSNRRVTDNDSLYSFTMDIPTVQDWINDANDTLQNRDYGVYIKPSVNSGKVVGFQALSSTSESIPRLYVIVEKPGVYVDTLDFIATMDIAAVKAVDPMLRSNIVVQGGTEMRSVLQFDISKLPEFAVINNAQLTLTLDTTASLSSVTENVYAYYITDTTRLDSLSNTYVLLTKSGNVITGNISVMVQRWLSEKKNFGILLVPQNNTETVDLLAFKGSSSVRLEERPQLKITYTNKK